MTEDRPPVAFYCVSNERYFLGAVGMLNSLRLAGHQEPVFLLDCGLTPEQRELLDPHVALVRARSDTPATVLKTAALLKTIAPLRCPAEVMVLIDVDMIVTRPLADLIERASGGDLVAFEDEQDRFYPEWGDLLDLGPVRRQPYLSAALVLLDRSMEEVLRLLDDRVRRVEFKHGHDQTPVADYPFMVLEQDVLNAILASKVERERIVAFDHRLAPTPPFRGLRLLDESSLRCAYEDGTAPYVLHHATLAEKPWLDRVYPDIYTQLLARLLVSRDLPVRVPQRLIPRRMRRNLVGRAERVRLDVRKRLGWYLRNHLPRRAVARVDARRVRRRGGSP
jgi:hypothetical protein